MPNIEDFIPKKRLFKSSNQISNFGNIKNISSIIDSLTNTSKKISEKQTKFKTNLGQTSDKVRTKLGQTEDKPRTELKTNLGQTSDKVRTNLGQTSDKVRTKLRQTEDKPRTELKTNLGQIKQESEVKNLTGVQLNIALFLFKLCKTNGSKLTGEIYIQSIMDKCKISKFSAQKSIQRLETKKIIVRKNFKNGRGGWTNYEIPESIFHEMLALESTFSVRLNLGQKLGQTEDNIQSSSLDLNYNTTNYLSRDFRDIFEFNLEPLSEIGFTENHAKQILKQGKLTAEEIQESIDHFAFDLAYNDKLKTIKTNPLAFFMGTLKKGDYYNPASNYESQKARNMRLSLEAKMKRQQAEKELENKLKEAEWKEWSDGLTEEALMEFYVEDKDLSTVPEKSRKVLIKRNALNNAQQYFESEIWPERRLSVMTELR